MSQFTHTPVLLSETIESLDVKKGKKYIDATLGGGGHTRAIIEKGGIVLGIDQDQEALEFVKQNNQYQITNVQLIIKYGNFRDIKKIAQENGFGEAEGILFDLGVSSHQLNTDNRGFSIRRNGPLDMRMDANLPITAAHIVNTYSIEQLTDIFQRFGEEENALAAAENIVKARKTKKIETTGELVATLSPVLKKQGLMHPATKIFQALRMEVNQELDALREGLMGGLEVLHENGVIVVISFHSLEDRIAKRIFSDWEQKGLGKIISKKPITAGIDEVRSNPRARSAKMRVFKKS